MRLLDRYLLRELLVPLSYCLGGFLLFWTVFDLFDNIGRFKEDGMRLWDIVAYYAILVPEFLVVVLPVGLLLALLYALTTHARNNEITAMRAAGISLWRIALPYLGIGLLASFVLLGLNELAVPDSAEWAERIRRRHQPAAAGATDRNQVRNLAFNNSRDKRIWRIGLYDALTGHMTEPRLVWTLPSGSVRWLAAARATPADPGWTFYDLREYREEPNSSNMPMPVMETNLMTFPELGETPEQIRSEIKLARSMMALRGTKKADIAIVEILHYLRLHPNPTRSDRDWLYTKLHGRLAAPWTCIVVVLIAIPFGAASGRRNVFFGVAGSIFICFLYFVLLQLGLALGSGGYLKPWLGAWLPNITFALTGILLTSRVR